MFKSANEYVPGASGVPATVTFLKTSFWCRNICPSRIKLPAVLCTSYMVSSTEFIPTVMSLGPSELVPVPMSAPWRTFQVPEKVFDVPVMLKSAAKELLY